MMDLWDSFVIQFKAHAPNIFWGVVVIILFWIVAWVVTRILVRVGKRMEASTVVVDLLGQVLKFALILIGLICGLGTMGINISALVAGFGILGFAVGFALKDVLSNLCAGMLLLYYKPFWVNDRIKVSGNEGFVTDVNLRYTELTDGERRILIPNSSLFTNTVEVITVGMKEELAGEPTPSEKKNGERGTSVP